MRSTILATILLLSLGSLCAQRTYLDSLRTNLSLTQSEDTSRVLALYALADYYGFIQFDSCLLYAAKTSALSEKLNYPFGRFLGYWSTFHGLNSRGDYAKALEAAQNLKNAAEAVKAERPWVITQSHYFFGLLNREMSNYPEAKDQFLQAIAWQKQTNEPTLGIFAACSQIGIIDANTHELDSALWYGQRGYDLGKNSKMFQMYFPLSIGALGNIHLALGNYEKAKMYFREAITKSSISDNVYFQVRNYNNLASLFDKLNERDSCIYYAGISLELSQKHNFAEFTLDACRMLYSSYNTLGKTDSILKYLRILLAARENVFSLAKVQQFLRSSFKEIQDQQEMNIQNERYRNRVRAYALTAGLCVFLLLAFFLFQNNKREKKAKRNIEKVYDLLKMTQAQLIQSEKMASLGELTAGIAHEIQNPLNFVNNFSELNSELIGELENEVEKGNIEEAKAIAKDIRANELKINYHGSRADSIVKGMLQHSRISSGHMEPFDINGLTEEYLELSYHGLQAKDKSFKASVRKNFDQKIPKINIIPQDMGRVLLNLYNNAFYSVTEKAKQMDLAFEPTVWVSTLLANNKIEIRVADNGYGIPSTIREKIFQPFFTTKPTGYGTGLGLSISYDIVRAHGGEIEVESKEGEGAVFILRLPT
jgi:two-component system, NtrC family, sensor kinase